MRTLFSEIYRVLLMNYLQRISLDLDTLKTDQDEEFCGQNGNTSVKSEIQTVF